MMGYIFCSGICIGCTKRFNFNPKCVPSAEVNGIRQPLCRSCIECLNIKREVLGLEPVSIIAGAYEYVDESDLM